MRLLEYQGRSLLGEQGLPVPDGVHVESAGEAGNAARGLGCPVVLKAQIPVGGRGKAGGIKFATSPEEAEQLAEDLLGSTLKGETVKSLLVVEKIDITQELYVSVILDRDLKKPVLIFSPTGGVDIEEVAERNPSAIQKVELDPLLGIQPYQIRQVLYQASIPEEIFQSLYKCIDDVSGAFFRYGATLVEINPLGISSENTLHVLDSKVIIDDESSSMETVKEILPASPRKAKETDLEERASKLGLQYVELEGDIGIIGNGAGLVMSTIDVLSQKGGKPANFLDIGGGADADLMENAYQLVLSKPEVEGLFINIFGGITRCDQIAKGLVSALEAEPSDSPLMVRLTGTNEEEGRKILEDFGIATSSTMEDAAEAIIGALSDQE
ncbi:MAG: ADP-forming succinate--CoA ligase subunit beta [Candidatus Bipolaricaulota bacterium]